MRSVSHASAKKRSKGSFRRRRLVMLMMTCFLSWAGVTLWDQVGKMNERGARIAALNEQLASVEQANQMYKFEVVRLNDPEYIEQQIRKELHYVKRGETLFMAPSK